ncbi:Uu.00g141720.m01.CDS01 [Anthostomella pinea]|uniref:Carboxylic ester hydrolase n=1 Tax=Anthostomella pinea TaxID=933095 RepID=A0AAI8VQA4_9PEZI|nr:Uu.00g141720.m01.CDS01 [Anthostomella pinea]
MPMALQYLVRAALCLLFSVGAAVSPTVELGCNKYTGVAKPYGITQWLGMRYAAPPVGQLRFMPPEDTSCNGALQVADTHGKICLETQGDPADNRTSEDCLFLDVYAPTNATSHAKLPVFFFIQGGGFNSNSNPDLDGRGLITASGHSIIVVTFNYRVGPYGFITDGDAITPNNGLRDQRKALEWVQKYISRFGGDPDHVVLGGDSAGAASISLQMAAFGGRDDHLFDAAAAESVSFATVLTIKESQYQYDNLAIQAGCVAANSLACLKSKTAEELQTVNSPIPYPGAAQAPLYMWNPVIDNDIIRDYTYKAFDEGKFVKVPAIFGDDTNGGTIFTPRDTSTLAESDSFLKSQFPYLSLEQLGKINDLYPKQNDTCPSAGCYWRQVSDVYGQMRYMCPGLYISSAMTRHGVARSYSYRYDVEDPAQVAQGLGVPHTVELNAIFGPENLGYAGSAPASYYRNGTNAAVVPVIQAYWTSFIRSFDPNRYRYPGSAIWEVWSERAQDRLLFETGGKTRMELVDDTTRRRCEYFYSIGLDIRQ